MSLTHLNHNGEAHMVGVGDKIESKRKAIASGIIRMLPSTLTLISNGQAKKGDVLATARIAAIMAAKKTSDLIPLCHNINITKVSVDFTLHEPDHIRCVASVECLGRTGVEMEALTAVSIGLLTIYDMCKAAEKSMQITDIGLLLKEGGKSGLWTA